MAHLYGRSLRRRRPGEGACSCCLMYGLGLGSLALAGGLVLARAARGRRAH